MPAADRDVVELHPAAERDNYLGAQVAAVNAELAMQTELNTRPNAEEPSKSQARGLKDRNHVESPGLFFPVLSFSSTLPINAHRRIHTRSTAPPIPLFILTLLAHHARDLLSHLLRRPLHQTHGHHEPPCLSKTTSLKTTKPNPTSQNVQGERMLEKLRLLNEDGLADDRQVPKLCHVHHVLRDAAGAFYPHVTCISHLQAEVANVCTGSLD
ncbi:uncharacterized protein EHS24_007577 [Apiotrichum porosum]|uniref:Uncharacterized protein n=1 Tax=Apiotrichum porosum TaxID=105984 RepID=A0A427XUU1_9TREE|nr:uncharacterized protein EHS24_007577 [Apiotrichum porosum]RSH82593.1 hypothetical protein EHS24_007577 [Apiotrichum porosum]